MKIFTANQMFSIEIMESLCHLPDSCIGINHYHFWCLKCLLWIQFPGKSFSMNPHYHANSIEFCHFRLRHKVSGIHKMHRINFAHILIGSRCHQRQKWMFLMTALSSPGANLMSSSGKRCSLNLPFPCPGPGQCHHLKTFVIHIQTCAQYFFQIQWRRSCIDNLHASGYDIHIFKNRKTKYCFQIQEFIFQGDLQCLTFFFRSECCRKTCQRFLAMKNLMFFVMELTSPMPRFCPHSQSCLTVISQSGCRIFLWKTPDKRSLFPYICLRRKRRFFCPQQIRC